MRKHMVGVLVITTLLVLSGCGKAVRGKSASPAGDPSLWIVLEDFSLSIGPNLQQSFNDYIEGTVFPSIHPGDQVVVGKIGSHPLSGFDVLSTHSFQWVFFRQPPMLSWQFISENPVHRQEECFEKFGTFRKALGVFQTKTSLKLSQRPTDYDTCLINTVDLIANDFARYKGGKILVLASDGLEDCDGLNFAGDPPTAETLQTVKAEGRIPNLSQVAVYFVCRNNHPPVPYQAIDSFWRDFFEEAGAKSVSVGPDPVFRYQPPATLKGQCGQ